MTASELTQADEAAEFLDEYYAELVRRKYRRRGDDLLSALIDTEDEGERLTFDELVQMCHMIVAAGSETTTYFLANGIRLFARHPEQADLVRRDPGLLGRAIDEVLRYDPPAHMVPRTISETVEVGGVKIPEGSRLMVMLAAANRDPAHFTDPDTFDVTREQSGPMSFGVGIHGCPGWRLARLQAEVVFPALLGRFSGIEITEPLRHRPRVAFPQVESLNVRFHTSPGEAR
nr:cytochrome P450 [Streptomyces sp. SID10853]